MLEPRKQFKEYTGNFPAAARAYEELGKAVHSHVRKALEAGVTPDELRHALVLALPTIGLPSMMAGLSRVVETVDAARHRRKKR